MRKNIWNGKLIVIEGLDGAGKTASAKKVCEQMGKRYNLVYCKGVGSDTFWGRIAKRFAKTFLFLLELLYAVNVRIIPNLKKGKVVLLDKYFYCVASHIPDVDNKLNKFWIRIFKPHIIQPDLVIYFNVTMKERIRRLKLDPYNKFHQKIINDPCWAAKRERRYRKIIEQFDSELETIYLNTTEKSRHEVVEMLKEIIENFLERGGI